jgi:hypothetical protein
MGSYGQRKDKNPGGQQGLEGKTVKPLQSPFLFPLPCQVISSFSPGGFFILRESIEGKRVNYLTGGRLSHK